MFKVPWHLFDKKLDLEMKNCEVVEGERRATRYGKLGNTVRGLVCEEGKGRRKRGRPVVAALEPRQAAHVGDDSLHWGGEEGEDLWY